MKDYLKKAFILSLVFNMILIVLLVYFERDGLILRVNNPVKKETINPVKKEKTIITDDQLKSFNNGFIPEFTDFCINRSEKKIKILIIGNSLTTTEVCLKAGKNHSGGLAATSIEKDYVHLLVKKIEKKLPDKNICVRISNFATFERNLASFKRRTTDSLVDFHPDIIIFQLGENVTSEELIDPLLFEEKYIELINCFKEKADPLIICTAPFFPDLLKNKIIEKVTISTNSYMVDLSHLPLLEDENYAKNEKNYLGDKSLWTVPGIGIHPGDVGMENIATQLFITINAAMWRNQ